MLQVASTCDDLLRDHRHNTCRLLSLMLQVSVDTTVHVPFLHCAMLSTYTCSCTSKACDLLKWLPSTQALSGQQHQDTLSRYLAACRYRLFGVLLREPASFHDTQVSQLVCC
jgi:hypothetical protein